MRTFRRLERLLAIDAADELVVATSIFKYVAYVLADWPHDLTEVGDVHLDVIHGVGGQEHPVDLLLGVEQTVGQEVHYALLGGAEVHYEHSLTSCKLSGGGMLQYGHDPQASQRISLAGHCQSDRNLG